MLFLVETMLVKRVLSSIFAWKIKRKIVSYLLIKVKKKAVLCFNSITYGLGNRSVFAKMRFEFHKFRLLINKKLVNIKSYKGFRKLKGLPLRGQRTHTNAKSSRKVKLYL